MYSCIDQLLTREAKLNHGSQRELKRKETQKQRQAVTSNCEEYIYKLKS